MASPAANQVDLLVVGGGPAGLSAALMFSRLRRPVVVYDSGLYRNVQSAVAHTILGNEGISPAAYRAKARKEIEEGYQRTSFVDGKITRLVKADKGFEAEDDKGGKVRARQVILATGIKDVLPSIPGLQEAWGRRAIHCIFCHGTETRDQPFGFLLTRANAKMNPMLVGSAFKLWKTLEHPMTYFLVHGIDMSTSEGLEESGLKEYLPYISANPQQYEVISDSIQSVASGESDLTLTFAQRPPLSVPHMLVFPERMQPTEDAVPLLTKDLLLAELTPFGAISPPDSALPAMALPPRMGDDPRTSVPGLYWAGNSGSPMANVNLAVAQGQQAAAYAAYSLGEEDAREMLSRVA